MSLQAHLGPYSNSAVLRARFSDASNRTPVTAEAIRNSWREVQTNKHSNPSVEKEGVTKEVGRPMQLSDKVGSVEVKKLGDVSSEYAEEVYMQWHILDKRRNATRMASYHMSSDVGMLTELRDEEAKEILRVLRDVGKKGQLLSPNAHWDRCHRHESDEGWENVVPKDDLSDAAIAARFAIRHESETPRVSMIYIPTACRTCRLKKEATGGRRGVMDTHRSQEIGDVESAITGIENGGVHVATRGAMAPWEKTPWR